MELHEAWEANARDWVAWTRRPGGDAYRFHRELFLALLPSPGRLTIDLGCGEGRLARDLKARGNAVVGVDASPTLLAFARAADPAMELHLADAAALPLADAVADLVVAFMSLHDVEDMPGAVREAARVLVPGGRLCVAIVHPLNAVGEFEGRQADAPLLVRGSYLEPSRYAFTEERDGLSMTFHSVHRPLEAYSRALEAAGFVLEAIREPALPSEAVRDEGDVRWTRIPLFLHLRARLPATPPP